MPGLRGFAWQAGYAAFAVSYSHIDAVKQYISTQAEHHRIATFQEEYLEFPRRHDFSFTRRPTCGLRNRTGITSRLDGRSDSIRAPKGPGSIARGGSPLAMDPNQGPASKGRRFVSGGMSGRQPPPVYKPPPLPG